MKLLLITLVGVLLGPTTITQAGEDGDEAERYAVVMIGKLEIRVIPADELESVRAEVMEEHRDRLAQYEQAKRAAKQAKEKFTDKKPMKPAFKILARSVDGREKADAIREKNLAKLAGPVFVVVQVGEHYQVTRKDEYLDLQKRVAQQHKEAMAAHKADPKGTPKPTKTKVRIVSKGFKSEEDANSYKERLSEKLGQKPRKSGKSKT